MLTIRGLLRGVLHRRGGHARVNAEPPALAQAEAGLRRFAFETGHLDAVALFAIEPIAGRLTIRVNSAHPVFPLLTSALCATGQASLPRDEPTEEYQLHLEDRLKHAEAGIRVLLAGWAQYEYELTGVRLRRAEEVRHDWGVVVRRIMAPLR